MLKTTTTDLDAEAWADAQVRRHTSWADTILGTGPHCTGMCRQGRALCVHPVECGVQRPVLDDAQLAPAEEMQSEPFKRAPTPQDIGNAVVTVVGFVLLILLFMAGVSWLLSPQGRAFFIWAGKTLAGLVS